MRTLVVRDQVLSRTLDEICAVGLAEPTSSGVTVDDGVGAIKESVLLPLRAFANLPLFSTYIAELGTAAAS